MLIRLVLALFSYFEFLENNFWKKYLCLPLDMASRRIPARAKNNKQQRGHRGRGGVSRGAQVEFVTKLSVALHATVERINHAKDKV
jgi:hypothetical protein